MIEKLYNAHLIRTMPYGSGLSVAALWMTSFRFPTVKEGPVSLHITVPAARG